MNRGDLNRRIGQLIVCLEIFEKSFLPAAYLRVVFNQKDVR
jgi:hypothetical protein